MKNNSFKFLAVVVSLALSMSAFAQASNQSDPDEVSPKVAHAGQVSVGLEFNPVAAFNATSPSALAGAGKFLFKDFIGPQEKQPNEMFFLAQNPMVSIATKYKITDRMAFKGSVGFSGGVVNYKEYIADDAAKAMNPLSEAQVADRISMHFTGGGVTAGLEFNAGKKSVRFIGGFGLKYAWGGGYANITYGNVMTDANIKPTSMAKIDTINTFPGTVQMDYARPVKQYGVGISHGIGLYANVGIEWFFIKNASLNFTADITPLMVAFQPQTYVIYEGFNKFNGTVGEYDKLVSPGSTYLLYGTDNLGCTLSLHYYF